MDMVELPMLFLQRFPEVILIVGWYGSLNVGYDYGLQKINGDVRTLGTGPRKGSDTSGWEIVKMDLMCKTVELTTGPW